MRSIWKIAQLIGLFCGVLSGCLLVSSAFDVGWDQSLEVVFNYYSELKEIALVPVMPIVLEIGASISKYLGIANNLADYWSDTLLILLLYFTARAKTYWSFGRRGYAVFRLLFGFALSVPAAVLVGLLNPFTPIESAIVGIVPVAAIVFYDLVDNFLRSLLTREHTETFSAALKRYNSYTLPLLVIYVAVLFAMILLNTINQQAVVDGLQFMVGLAVTLAAYWYWRGLVSARERSALSNDGILVAFAGSRATATATYMTRRGNV
ncbi:MAG: hypothetical protein AAGL17_16350 [Cyanobacteria bacterium J06576_12]